MNINHWLVGWLILLNIVSEKEKEREKERGIWYEDELIKEKKMNDDDDDDGE